jgi:tetratricopeptide (TPR) repeat protein
MLTVSPITRQTVGKTFTMAISVLGVGAVLQLGSVCWVFAMRLRAQPLSLTEGDGGQLIARVNPGEKGLDLNSDPLADGSAGANGNAVAAPKPTPAPVSVQKEEDNPPANRFEEQIAQGKILRDRGDTNTALTRFREAAATDPQSPIPIAELASTYEKMGLAEKASEQWRLIYDMGEKAGIYFSLAEAKLKVAMKDAENTPAAPPANEEVEGIAPGMTLGLLPIKVEDKNDELSAKRFALHIPIKARPKAKIDPHELVIHVLFFDILNGQNVVQTSADVSSRWVTAPADWVDSDTEELAVDYQLPKPEPRTRENRKYFGYIVRIYYKKQLQAAISDPERLGREYPAPPTLPKDSEK